MKNESKKKKTGKNESKKKKTDHYRQSINI